MEENLPSAVGTLELVDAWGTPTLTVASPGAAVPLDGWTASSAPILATDGRKLGTLTLYLPASREPTDDQKQTLVRAAYLSGSRSSEARWRSSCASSRRTSSRCERTSERASLAIFDDELGQSLIGAQARHGVARAAPAGRAGPRRPRAAREDPEMCEMTDEVIERVRRISGELRPGVLDDLGLLAAIEWQGQEFEKRTGTGCVVTRDLGEAPLGASCRRRCSASSRRR